MIWGVFVSDQVPEVESDPVITWNEQEAASSIDKGKWMKSSASRRHVIKDKMIFRDRLDVRFRQFPVGFLPCRFGSITVLFLDGSVPPLSGSISALPVRFHCGSVPRRFGSTAFRFGFGNAGSVPLRFGSCWCRFPVPGSVPRPS